MRKKKNIATIADIVVLVAVTLLNPLLFTLKLPPAIPDKVVRYYEPVLTADSIEHAIALTEKEMDEMSYYLRLHNVMDDGYNLVAAYNNTLQQRLQVLKHKQRTASNTQRRPKTVKVQRIAAKDRPLIAVKMQNGYWKAGCYYTIPLKGEGITRDDEGRIVCALWDADTVVKARRIDSLGVYNGQMNSFLEPDGEGTFDCRDGSHYEGLWQSGKRHGFGFESSPYHQVRIGQWKKDRFLGEKIRYTSERIYGIDISRHQHEIGRKRYGINWRQIRITSLGRKHNTEGLTYPVSFVYIKSTEGTSIRNRYFLKDYMDANKQGIHVGAYHFFSLKSSAIEQANYFVNHTLIRETDFPPVLDVEPSDAQIAQIGGGEELLKRVRQWLELVERRTHKRPILYINQMFVNKYLGKADDIKHHYNVWIARYGEYKPDVKLVYWQLTPEGRVDGITGPVDINVFNGFQGQFDEFCRTGFHK